MSYEYKKNIYRVTLKVIAGADESLVGLKIGNNEFISMTFAELLDIVMKVSGEKERRLFCLKLFENNVRNDEKIIVLETVENSETENGLDESIIFKLLQLYKAQDIYPCYTTSYRWRNNEICNGGIAYLVKYQHGIDFLPKNYAMSEEEKIEFISWYNKYKKLYMEKGNDIIKFALESYFNSYLVGMVEQSFIMLFVVLETLFGGENVEISYQIRRGTSLFLSDSVEEMKEIYKNVKKLYDVRSKYVHKGQKIDWKYLFELRDIVRRVLVKMFDCGCHRNDFNHREFLQEITFGGYESDLL